MHQITSEKFRDLVYLDPEWAAHLTEPVEITDFCGLTDSRITHLSPLLHFKGQNKDGDAAYFQDCPNLKLVEGTFHGAVHFARCGIEKIHTENMKILKTNQAGLAAVFADCRHLQTAQGTFPGFVSFIASLIIEIDPEKLSIENPDAYGEAASFRNCRLLQVAQGNFPGRVDFSESGICRIDPQKLKIIKNSNIGTCAQFIECTNLKKLEGRFPGYVDIRSSGIKTVDPDFRIEEIDMCGELIRIAETPIAECPKELQNLARCLMAGRAKEEITKILETIDPNMETELWEAIQNQIRRMETAERKNAAVEIQID